MASDLRPISRLQVIGIRTPSAHAGACRPHLRMASKSKETRSTRLSLELPLVVSLYTSLALCDCSGPQKVRSLLTVTLFALLTHSPCLSSKWLANTQEPRRSSWSIPLSSVSVLVGPTAGGGLLTRAYHTAFYTHLYAS